MQCPVTLPVPELDRRGSSPVLLVTAAMGVRLLSPHTSHPAHGRSCWPLIHFFSPSPSHPPASLTWVVATAFPVGSHSHPRPWIVCSPHTSHCDPCKTGRNSSLSCSNLPAASHLPPKEIPSPPGAIQPNQLLFPMASLLSSVSCSAPQGASVTRRLCCCSAPKAQSPMWASRFCPLRLLPLTSHFLPVISI